MVMRWGMVFGAIVGQVGMASTPVDELLALSGPILLSMVTKSCISFPIRWGSWKSWKSWKSRKRLQM
jgi:hypothetical protein